MPAETVLRNARIVLADEIVDGSLTISDSDIADFDAGGSSAGEDLEGDYLIPGLIELHTDHLEGHYSPRPGVRWNTVAAIQAHDAQIATSGITTVFDCLRMGSDEDGGFGPGEKVQIGGLLALVTGCARSISFICAARFQPLTC